MDLYADLFLRHKPMVIKCFCENVEYQPNWAIYPCKCSPKADHAKKRNESQEPFPKPLRNDWARGVDGNN